MRTTQLDTPCVMFAGWRCPLGYGKTKRGGKTQLAHRLAYADAHGAIPAGMLVCHKCDNPGCVNVGHLFLGTPKDNRDDMVSKGRERYLRGPEMHATRRTARGSRVGTAKLSDGDAIVVQMLAAERVDTHAAIAAVFRLSKGYVGDLGRGVRRTL